MGLTQLIDAALAPIAPGLVLRRQVARARIDQVRTAVALRDSRMAAAWRMWGFGGVGGYDGARHDRTNKDQMTRTLSGDMAGLPDRQTLADRAGHQIRNDGWAASAQNNFRKRLGRITPKAAARDPQTGELLEPINEQLDRLWKRWSRRPRLVDREGFKTFSEFQGLAAAEFVRAGEALVLKGYTPRPHTVGLWLQAIEPEQLALDMTETPDGAEVRDGIEVDEAGRPIAYWVYTGRHPLEDLRARNMAERIPAARIIHFHRQTRVRQSHGVSLLANALPRLHSIRKYDEAELFAMWMEACQGLIDKNDPDGTDVDLGYTAQSPGEAAVTGSESPEGTREEVVFQPGMIARGNFEAFSPQHPNAQGEKFIKMQLRGMAAGLGIDYANLANDYDGTFSSRRQGMIEEYGSIEPLQDLVVDAGVGTSVWEEFVFLAVLEGRIDGLDFQRFASDPMSYLEADWAPPARPWIDPAKEAAGAKIELDYRLNNRTALLNRRGESFRDNIQRIAEERTYADAYGVKFPEDAPGGPSVSPSEPRPTRGQGEDDDDEEEGREARRGTDRLVNAVLEAACLEGDR